MAADYWVRGGVLDVGYTIPPVPSWQSATPGEGRGPLAYRPSLRLAAHVLHWGHVPLSYAESEGLLRAASVR